MRLLQVFALLLAPFGVMAQAAPSVRLPGDADVEARMRAFVDEARLAPGVVVGLRDSTGRRVLAHGRSGLRDSPALAPAMRFEAGSITKGFTGLLLAEMAARGEVRLDQPIGSLLPPGYAVSPEAAAITLEALSTHHSGLPRLPLEPRMIVRGLAGDPYAGSSAANLFEALARQSSSRIEANRGRFEYSNFGVALLGQLLAQRAGRPYEALLRERVLAPLGIDGAAIPTGTAREGDMARGHRGTRPVSPWTLDAYAPAGGLVLDADALLDLGEHMLASEPAFVADALRPRRSFGGDGDGGSKVGLGWFHDAVGGHDVVWHNGGTAGMRSYFGVVPARGWIVVVLANGEGDADALAAQLLDPSRPAMSRKVAWQSLLFTVLGLLAAPAWLWWIALPMRRREGGFDRVKALGMVAGAVMLLVVVRVLGNWRDLSFAWWWVSLAGSVAMGGWLAWRLRDAPWLAAGRWGTWRAAMAALSLAVALALLLLG